MSRRPRRNHAAAFKAKMTLAAIKSEKTLAELAEQFDTCLVVRHCNHVDRNDRY